MFAYSFNSIKYFLYLIIIINEINEFYIWILNFIISCYRFFFISLVIIKNILSSLKYSNNNNKELSIEISLTQIISIYLLFIILYLENFIFLFELIYLSFI